MTGVVDGEEDEAQIDAVPQNQHIRPVTCRGPESLHHRAERAPIS